MDLELKGRVAVITGPAKGMGAAVSKAFAQEGCKLALIGRDTKAIEPIAKEIKDGGGEAIIVPCDVTSTDACESAAKAAGDKFGGRIDILVNVAGGSGPIGKTGAETTADEFDEIVTLNMNGCFNTMHAVLPAMMAQRYGKIVNVGGTFGMRGRAGRMAYSASKWGLRGITKSFALEVGQYNINVNYVAPGMVDGPRFRDKVCADMAKKLNITVEEAAQRHANDYALKRVTTDADVANACLFFASDVSRQITGADVPVDGGVGRVMSVTADLVLTGGKVVSPDTVIEASIAIKDGKILSVGATDSMPPAKETVDVSGMHVLPGAIDVHVHFRDPGYPHKEDFTSGTIAAAFGGVTTVFDMPNTIPTVNNPQALAAKLKMASEKAHVDFGLYAVLGDDSIEHVPALVETGVIGFKLYMGNTFGKIPSPSTGAMLEAFEVVAPTGKRISLHAETNSIMERRESRLRAAGRTDPMAHLDSRPAVVAVEAVSRAAILAEWTGARIHVLHISSAEELRPLGEAKARGVDITGETCPHYLMLSADDYARFAGVIRVNPPVREKRNQEPLWAALADGTVDLIATDHAPHAREEKTRNDMFDVDCGFPGVETQMPLMLTQVNAGRMTIMDYVALSAAKPAKTFGLYPRKGVIAPGAEADIAVVDLKRDWTIDDAKLQSRSRVTPFHGMKVKGLPIHTLVRGRFVMRDRALVEGTRGHGRSVHTIQQMPAAAPQNTDQTMASITRVPARPTESAA